MIIEIWNLVIKFGHCLFVSTFFFLLFCHPPPSPLILEQSLAGSHQLLPQSYKKSSFFLCKWPKISIARRRNSSHVCPLCSQTHSSHNIWINNCIVIKESLGKSVYFHISIRHNHHSSHSILFSHAHYAIWIQNMVELNIQCAKYAKRCIMQLELWLYIIVANVNVLKVN